MKISFILAMPIWLLGATYQIKHDHIGAVKTVVVNDTVELPVLARQYDLGYDELLNANPMLSAAKPITAGSVVILPTKYILPQAARKGIVINLPEKRMYIYRNNQVLTYPVGIGRQGWATPEGKLFVASKKKNPHWFVPKAVLKVQKENGVNLPKVMPPGPDNPLGKYAIKLSKSNYLIHGTNAPVGVGQRISAGCLRMYPEDIKELYGYVYKNMPVAIVNQPFKVSKIGQDWYVEAYQPLVEDADDRNLADGGAASTSLSQDEASELIISSIVQAGAPIPNMGWIKSTLSSSTGIPTVIVKHDKTENFIYELKRHRI